MHFAHYSPNAHLKLEYFRLYYYNIMALGLGQKSYYLRYDWPAGLSVHTYINWYLVTAHTHVTAHTFTQGERAKIVQIWHDLQIIANNM